MLCVQFNYALSLGIKGFTAADYERVFAIDGWTLHETVVCVLFLCLCVCLLCCLPVIVRV